MANISLHRYPAIAIIAIIAITFLFPIFTISAQKISSFQNFTYLTDFPQNTVQSILQDSSGYIWIGTEGGLNRYDGKKVVSFNEGQNDNFSFEGKGVNSMVEDDSHNLWIASTKGGINIFSPGGTLDKNKTLRLISNRINKALQGNTIECIKILRNKTILLGLKEGIASYNPFTSKITTIPSFTFKGKVHKPYIVNIGELSDGSIVITSTSNGVFILTGSLIPQRLYFEEFDLHSAEFYTINALQLPNDMMIYATIDGLYIQNLKLRTGPTRLKNANGFLIAEKRFNCLAWDDKNNWILAGSNADGIFTLNSAGIPIDQLKDSKNLKRLQSNTIYSLLVDRHGLGIWVGTSTGLTKFFYSEDIFSRVHLTDELDGTYLKIYPIYTEDNKNILIGTNKYLFNYNIEKRESRRIALVPDIQLRFNYISRVAANLYLFATAKGVYYSHSLSFSLLNNLSSKYQELKILNDKNIFCILPLNENEILFGARGTEDGGLFYWKKNSQKIISYKENPNDPNSLSSNIVNHLTKNTNGEIIVCTNKGYCYFDPALQQFKKIKLENSSEINNLQVNYALPDSEYLWLGTYGKGINLIKNDSKNFESITTNEGLPNNEIYTLHKGLKNEIWISTNKGLAVFDKFSKKIKIYDRTDGLANNEFNRTSSFRLGDTLYFGGLTGLTFLNLKNIKANNLAPFADITKISILKPTGEQIIIPDSTGFIKVNYSENTFKIYLSSPYYINSQNTKFFYRIIPGHSEWINNGYNNELIISQLPPGRHQLEVKSKSSDGIESYNIKTVTIRVIPPWYQTFFFKILLILLVVGLLFAFYRSRITHLKKEDKIRNQLALDLHDDLGSTLNSVNVYSNLALMEKENLKHLERIKQSTQEAISSIRDLIWVLDDKKDTIRDLLTRINLFTVPLCEANSIQFTQSANNFSQSYKLGKEEKRNLYMIIKEAINNSLKYADCKNIDFTIERTHKKLKIIIYDDGIGFSEKKLTIGNGLKNFHTRCKAIRYSVFIESAPNNGTSIILNKL